jgi:hypothetical protein
LLSSFPSVKTGQQGGPLFRARLQKVTKVIKLWGFHSEETEPFFPSFTSVENLQTRIQSTLTEDNKDNKVLVFFIPKNGTFLSFVCFCWKSSWTLRAQQQKLVPS